MIFFYDYKEIEVEEFVMFVKFVIKYDGSYFCVVEELYYFFELELLIVVIVRFFFSWGGEG